MCAASDGGHGRKNTNAKTHLTASSDRVSGFATSEGTNVSFTTGGSFELVLACLTMPAVAASACNGSAFCVGRFSAWSKNTNLPAVASRFVLIHKTFGSAARMEHACHQLAGTDGVDVWKVAIVILIAACNEARG